jgi:RNA polymerase sigma factor (sigma-70 family)
MYPGRPQVRRFSFNRRFATKPLLRCSSRQKVEAGFATTTRVGVLGGRSPLLRLQSDGRLIALLRAGNDAAFDVLFSRYRSRLLAFCRHMLGSKEDAEDILQDVFAAAYNAILADRREINARPWLYRIARNRCLNHLRRPVPDGRDTMDDQLALGGASTADVVHKRADLRNLLADVQKLPETQRTALLLREIDALSYDQISEAMETTVPSVKSLLVRARMSLAEASEARQLTCDEVRMALAEVAEGIRRTTPPLKRHVRDCEDCQNYRKQLRKTSTAMAVVFPVAPLLFLKKLILAKAGAAALAGGAGGGGGGAAATTGVAAAGATSGASAGGVAGGALVGAATSKAIAGVAVTAIIAGGAVEAKRVTVNQTKPARPPAASTIVRSPAQTTGGVSLAGAPPAFLEKAKAKEIKKEQAAKARAKAVKARAKHATGTTGPAGATGGAGVTAPPAGTSTAGGQPAPVPVSGSSTTGAQGGTVETGGATPPPLNAKPPAPSAGNSGAVPPAGPTGTTGP